jgi:hypothetical protein
MKSGCAGEVDLFSLDIDGNDYWIWNAINAINPRLLVFETHNISHLTGALPSSTGQILTAGADWP